MCPVSSVLEASNAGHFNSESMTKRWTRGFVPRIGREVFYYYYYYYYYYFRKMLGSYCFFFFFLQVIFGVGLNQLSDALEERIQGFFSFLFFLFFFFFFCIPSNSNFSLKPKTKN